MQETSSNCTVQLDGSLTVPFADVIHARLLAALEDPRPVIVDVSAATEIDVSFLQILVAAQKSASALRKTLRISSHGSSLLRNEVMRCGLSSMAMVDGRPVLPEILEGPTQ